MRALSFVLVVAAFVLAGGHPGTTGGRATGSPLQGHEDRIWHHRNLGKAFYENPTTQREAVTEFKGALDLAPDSARERLNYALALLRAARTEEGIAELQKVQQQDASIPHSWFNLGIVFKKAAQYDRAIEQFRKMIELVPEEPISHYNLAVLYKLAGKTQLALDHFEVSSRLDPHLAGPHFQLYNAYRMAGRNDEAERELRLFQELKKKQEGAAIPEDLEWSVYSEIYEILESAASDPRTSRAELLFESVLLDDQIYADGGVVVLDADADQAPDLLVWSSDQVRIYRNSVARGEPPARPYKESESITGGLSKIRSVAPADYNNDGWTDLCVVTEAEAVLFANRKGRFEKSATLPAGRFVRAIWFDYDHDYDLDLFLLGEKCVLARNGAAAGFVDQSMAFPFISGRALDGAVFDLIMDTNGTDLLVTYEDREAVLYRDKLLGKYEAISLESVPAGTRSIMPVDINRDGWTDLMAATPSGPLALVNRQGKLDAVRLPGSTSGPILVADLENRGRLDLICGNAVYRDLGLESEPRASASGLRTGNGNRSLTVAALPETMFASVDVDSDGDGRVDLAILTDAGKLHLLRNETETKNRWIRLAFAGVKNLKQAPGAEVELKAGSWYQKRLYHGVPLTIGVGSFEVLDVVRITWPNGLIQNETQQPAGQSLTYKEKQRLSGSCPMVFSWNGKEFQFITDVLGVAPLGASSGDGQFFPVDHDEYVQIPRESLSAVNGNYEIRITEELREVTYLDQVKLIAVDHAGDVELFTNDKFKAPPFPEFRLFGIQRRLYPLRVSDHRGRDVRRRIMRRDRTYPNGFARDYSGVAELHSLELDFGPEAARNGRAVLVLSGWVDWADGSTFFQASQEGRAALMMPYLQVKDAAGKWRTVIEDMGIPAGKPKTIVVDLTGKFLSQSREVRIVTNLCVFWDEIFLSEETAEPRVELRPLPFRLAELRFRGFSTPIVHPERKQPESFDYSRWMALSMWNPTPGLYTRFGDVRELLASADDRFVIMGSGDELRLLFDPRSLPPLQKGLRRDFLLYVDGWAKDGDPNTAFSQSVDPLPFHEMSCYPYPAGERYPGDRGHQEYQTLYNTRPALRLVRQLWTN